MQRGVLLADTDVGGNAEMMVEHPVNLGKFCVPLFPVMTAGYDMEFVLEPSFTHKRGESSVGRLQPFLVTTREKEVWGLCDVGGADKHVRIVFVLVLTIPGAKDRPVMPPL